MNIDARVEAWASLQLMPGLGGRGLVTLLKAFGGPEEVLAASRASLSRHVPVEVAATIERGPERAALQQTLDWLAHDGNALVAWDDADYPRALLSIPDPPASFHFAGRRELLNQPAVAIVGSRNATPQGLDNAEAFAAALSAAGVTVISGLAVGIDAAAHRGGLTGVGSSLAVVGTGLDRVYPAANRDLAHRLAETGGLISEFALGTAPLPANFPRRNRLISGLARGVLVVEAALRSGSLITARLAADQGRDVFAIPGSIHATLSKGCHKLIKDGAKLVETAQDVLEELGLASGTGSVPPVGSQEATTGEPGKVLAALGHDPTGVDALSKRTGLPAEAVTVALLQLELAGKVAGLPGGVFQRRG
jgi:DNA processing protein